MVVVLMMSAKLLNLGLLKLNRYFQKRGYDVIIFVHEVTNGILSRDSQYTNSDVCKSYRGKTGKGGFLPQFPPVILKRVNNSKPWRM